MLRWLLTSTRYVQFDLVAYVCIVIVNRLKISQFTNTLQAKLVRIDQTFSCFRPKFSYM